MIRLTKEKVLLLHRMMASETGGSIGIRDEGLLESALEGAFLGFGNEEFYPTIEEKAAKIGYSLVSNHAFVDGNKRIGLYVMLTFLEVNDMLVECTNEELVVLGLSLAEGKVSYEKLLEWIKEHCTSNPEYGRG